MSVDFEHIVIGGQQRSGTSLVRAIIGSHSDISIFQWDLTLWPKFSEIYADKPLSHSKKKELIQGVLAHKKVIQTDVSFQLSEFNEILNSAEDSTKFFYEFYETFLNLYIKKTNRKIPGLKTPENEFYAHRIFSNFPKTKFIHVVRNPLDVAVSLKGAKDKWWGGKINYLSHIRLWKNSAQLALSNSKLYPQNYLVIKYEDVVQNQKETILKVCNFLEVDFEPQMLAMKNHPGWKGHNSSFKNSKSKTGKSSPINRYKQQLPEEIQNQYFFFLKQELQDLNYESENSEISTFNKLKYEINSVSDSITEKTLRMIRRSVLYKTVKSLVS